MFMSPPPETVTVFVTEDGAFAATLTVTVNTREVLGAIALLVVQDNVGRSHIQRLPLMSVAVRPNGSVSTTFTVPVVGPEPMLKTWIVY